MDLDGEPDDGFQGESGGGGRSSKEMVMMRQLLQQTSSAVVDLSRRPQDEMAVLMAGGEDGSRSSGSAVPGARGAAARETQRPWIELHPKENVQATRSLLGRSTTPLQLRCEFWLAPQLVLRQLTSWLSGGRRRPSGAFLRPWTCRY